MVRFSLTSLSVHLRTLKPLVVHFLILTGKPLRLEEGMEVIGLERPVCNSHTRRQRTHAATPPGFSAHPHRDPLQEESLFILTYIRPSHSDYLRATYPSLYPPSQSSYCMPPPPPQVPSLTSRCLADLGLQSPDTKDGRGGSATGWGHGGLGV